MERLGLLTAVWLLAAAPVWAADIRPAPYPVLAERLKAPEPDQPLPVRAMYLHCIWQNEGATTLWGEKEWRDYIDYLAALKATMVSVYLWPIDKYGKTHLRSSADPTSDNPATKARVAMYQKLCDYAHGKGIEFWLGWSINAVPPGFAKQHRDWLATGGSDLGGEGCLLCPSLPEARKALLDLTREQAALYPKCDGFFMGGIDLGGCQCERCKPWWKTTCGLFKEHADAIKSVAPKARTAFCVWGYGAAEARQMIPLMPKDAVLQVDSRNADVMADAVKAGLETWMFLELDMETQMDFICPLHERIKAAVDRVRQAGGKGVMGFSITPPFKVENEATMLACALNAKLSADEGLALGVNALYGPDLGPRLLPVYQELSKVWLLTGRAFVPMGAPPNDPKAAFHALRDLRKRWAAMEPELGKFPLLTKTFDHLARVNAYREVRPEELKASAVFLGVPASEANVLVAGFAYAKAEPYPDETGAAYPHQVVGDTNIIFLRREPKPSHINVVIWDEIKFEATISVAVNGKKVGEYLRGRKPGKHWVVFSFPVPADVLKESGAQEVSITRVGYPFAVAYVGFTDQPATELPKP
jgi:hypothetical protein